VDITPPLEVGLLMSSVERRWEPFTGVRLPLCARSLVLEQNEVRVVLVSLELLGLADRAVNGMEQFRRAVIQAAGQSIREDQLILTSVHTHSAPDSLALTDLCLTSPYQAWIERVAAQVGRSIRDALEGLHPCSLCTGSMMLPGLAIHRRIRTTEGVLLSHPVPPPEIIISREGAVDHAVQVVALMDASDQPRALLVNAACHPVHEMCIPLVSPDYPGVMSTALEREHSGCTALFLNGAAGNVNPPAVSDGAAAADRHGLRLAEQVSLMLRSLRRIPRPVLDVARVSLTLAERNTVDESPVAISTGLAAMRLGDAGLVFLPGEPFAETGLAIRGASRFPLTAVVGYSEASIGYIPTDEAFEEGGYETLPGAWSRVAPGSERAIRKTAVDLLGSLCTTGLPGAERVNPAASARS
jgi:hypothetical protein